MFISDAFAAEGAQAGGDMSMIIVLTVCMLAVYFFVMRPNSKKRKEMQKLLDNLAVGDEILTNGGIAGRIVKLPDNKEYVLVEIGAGMVMQIKRNYVVAVLPKGTLVATEAPAVSKSSSSSSARRPARRARPTRRKEEVKEEAVSQEKKEESVEEKALEAKAQDESAKEVEPAKEEAASDTQAQPSKAEEAQATKDKKEESK